jgi:ATP-dependent Lhr-like helicase
LGFLTQSELAANAWSALLDELIAQRRAARFAHLHIPAERLPQFQALFADAACDASIAAPAEFAAVAWTRETALADLLRARLTGLGPVRAADLAATLHLPPVEIDTALLALEREGTVMQGHFTPKPTSAQGSADESAFRDSENVARLDRDRFGAGRGRMPDPATSEMEWCDRHLLARIHRYTVQRLRREIEPVEPRDFMRFLFDWQKVSSGARVEGPDALAAVLAQLEGFEAPAAAWESEILPARVAGYEISWLDDLCLAGRVVWSRLRPKTSSGAEHGGGPVRATPIVLLQRRNLGVWNALGEGAQDADTALSSRAQLAADFLRSHGASFFDELLARTHLLHVELEEALAELVAAGQINSDSFAGLRALLVPQSKRPSPSRRRGRRTALLGIADAGRWSSLRRAASDADADTQIVEHVARTLLRRYGVVCWRLLAREAAWLPPWRDLLRVYQRLEARGEIRGGRFIAGLSGEQFALPEAIAPLRAVRQKPADGSLVAVCGADPLNLVGAIVAGDKVPALSGSRILYRDGVLVATLVSGTFAARVPMDAAMEWKAKSMLLRGGERESAAANV